MNSGHLAAWGAIVAGQLTESHTRYTMMTREHIVFSRKDNRVRVVGGGSGIIPINWPADARLHHKDISGFQNEFGPAHTSVLRLGYAYRLGPIGEWIFFEAEEEALLGPPPQAWAEEWDAPSGVLVLGDDCSLTPDMAAHITQLGAGLRKQGLCAAAKRCFMRCFLAGLAEGNETAMAVALGNLATVYEDEGRWLRAFGLALSALFLAGAMNIDEPWKKWIASVWQTARSHITPDVADSMVRIAGNAKVGDALPEIIWRLEDFEIRRAVQDCRQHQLH